MFRSLILTAFAVFGFCAIAPQGAQAGDTRQQPSTWEGDQRLVTPPPGQVCTTAPAPRQERCREEPKYRPPPRTVVVREVRTRQVFRTREVRRSGYCRGGTNLWDVVALGMVMASQRCPPKPQYQPMPQQCPPQYWEESPVQPQKPCGCQKQVQPVASAPQPAVRTLPAEARPQAAPAKLCATTKPVYVPAPTEAKPAAAPAPVVAAPAATPSVTERLQQLTELHKQKLITDEEYAAKKAEILKSL